MCRTQLNHADTRSRSQFKVTALSLGFRARSVSPIPVERFSLNFGQMFILVRRCAESIIQPCRLKVNVTVQDHGFEPWISYPLRISFTSGRIFSKLWSSVHLSGTMCRTHNSALRTKGQDHSWRSRVCARLDLSVSYSSWGLGRAAVCDCGTPWTFLFPFFLNLVSAPYLLYPWKDFP